MSNRISSDIAKIYFSNIKKDASVLRVLNMCKASLATKSDKKFMSTDEYALCRILVTDKQIVKLRRESNLWKLWEI